MQKMEEPCIFKETKAKPMEFPNNESMKNDHHQRPYFYYIPFISRMLYNIIIVSIWVYSIAFYCMLRICIIIMCMHYDLWLLHHTTLNTHLYHLLDNIIVILLWTNCGMYTCFLHMA